MQLINFGYDRSSVKAGIAHIGVGNFHRAHMEYYTNLLLNTPSQNQWGICGVMLLDSDERLYKALKEQKGEYTLTVCGRKGNDEVLSIGSLVDVLWAKENKQAVINKLASADIKIISLTITEGGYNINKTTGEFDLENAQVKHDLNNCNDPQSVFGYVAAALRIRKEQGIGGVTILSCDNLQHNGNTTKKAFCSFIKALDEDLYNWVLTNVTFPNSMVDRITPATLPQDIERLNAKNCTHDLAPVYCEDFIQWVVEDNFVAGRPAYEQVGAIMTDNVDAYENMKLNLLNASHTLLSYPSFLAGYRKVDEALADQNIVTFIRDFMDKDITKYVPAPQGINLDEYKQTLIERFANKSVSDQIARLCFDGISKFPVYIVPNIKKIFADGSDFTRIAYLLAAYRQYLKVRVDDKGNSFEIAEPWLTAEDKTVIASDNAQDFLGLSAFNAVNLKANQAFVDCYLAMVEAIAKNGAYETLKNEVL